MSDISALVTELKTLASIETSEGISDPDVQKYLTDALAQHDKFSSFLSLSVEEEEPVLTLAWAKICLVRASKFSKDGNISGAAGYGADRQTPYAKSMAMADSLIKRYGLLCNNLKIGKNRIVVGQLFVRDQLVDALVPLLGSSDMPRIMLTLASSTSTTAVLRWLCDDVSDFFEFIIFMQTGSTANYQEWNNHSATGVPRIADDSVKLITLNDPTKISIKVTDLATVSYKFIVVLRTRSGKYSYSNELSVTLA